MKKRVLLIATVAILVGANFALRYMHISKIEETIGIISDKLSEQGLKFSYQSISYSGLWCWEVSGRILNPVFLREVHGYSDQSDFENIDFSSTLIKKSINISSSDKSNTVIKDSKGEHKYISTFTERPNINIKFKGYFFNHNQFFGNNTLEKYLVQHVEQINYNSSGHTSSAIDSTTGKESPIYTIANFAVEAKNQANQERNGFAIKINIDKNKYFHSPATPAYFSLLSEAGESDYVLDANLLFDFKDDIKTIALNDSVVIEDIKPIYKLHIADFKLTTQVYSVGMQGDAIIAKNQLLPYFDMNFSIVNSKEMLGFYAKLYNSFIYQADIMKALPLQPFTQKQQDSVLKVFEKISKKSQDAGDSIVHASKLKDAPIKLSDYTIDQVIDMYYELMSQDNGGVSNQQKNDNIVKESVETPSKQSS